LKSAAAAAAKATNLGVFNPSQTLVYEDPEAQKQREGLIRKMGGTVDEDARGRVMSIGAVKDAKDEQSGVGQRLRRRARG